jgi:serine/threonine protein kinase
MRVSLDERLFKDSTILKYGSDDYFFKESKLKLFGDLLYRKEAAKTQFVLQTHHTNKGSRVINHSLRIYEDASAFCAEKGSKIKIDTPVDDPNIFGSRIFVGKVQGKPGDFVLKAVPFTRYEEEAFKRGLYEVAMLQRMLTEENNRYGYVFTDAFVVESGMGKDKNDKSLILIGETSSASLYEIINFRKLTKMPWSESQFENLCFQLIRGVMELHNNKIAHRDIRPSNIFYCANKHGYVLGGLQNSIKMEDDARVGYNLCGVPYYLPTYLIEIGKREDFSEYYNYEPQKNDIYALGVTLMNCLFLDVFTSPQILADSLQKYYGKYAFLKLIKQMISENPPSLKDVLTTLAGGEGWLEEKTNIEALRFRLKPQDDEFVNRKKIIAEGYYSMFLYDQWVEEINEVVNYYEMNKNHMQLGDVYKQIADIYRDHEQNQSKRLAM